MSVTTGSSSDGFVPLRPEPAERGEGVEASDPRESGRLDAENRIKQAMASGAAEVWHEMTFNREPDVEQDYRMLVQWCAALHTEVCRLAGEMNALERPSPAAE